MIKELKEDIEACELFLKEHYDTTYKELMKQENTAEFEAGYISGCKRAIDLLKEINFEED